MLSQTDSEGQKLLRMILHALRHDPRKYGLNLDPEGWARIEDLILALRYFHFRWESLQWPDVEMMIRSNAPNRFQVGDGRIRASYGHSITLSSVPATACPPEILFHGTDKDAVCEIGQAGLKPMGRQFVHLTANREYAFQVASTKASGILVLIRAQQAHHAGISFHPANPHVWLTKEVPSLFITFLDV